MLMKAMQKIAQDDQGAPVVDCVLAVPAYFTDAERHAMLDAANIAGLNCLRLMNDTTAGLPSLTFTPIRWSSCDPPLLRHGDISTFLC